ncbi:MAG: GNAT family N-acetyltransferase [Chloroflexota bacterium]|nr:GNAT family N-acetyltransferase [Chloroflexota bacterium]
MTIRQLFPDDASEFQALRLAGLLECPEAFTSSHAEEVDTPLDVIAGRLAPKDDSAVFGYFTGGRLIGLIGVQRESRRKLSHKAFIWGMYVAREHRRKGIGRSLMARALDHATSSLEVKMVNLGVNTQNSAAITLYRAMGFETYGTERGFITIDGIAHDQHLMSHHF